MSWKIGKQYPGHNSRIAISNAIVMYIRAVIAKHRQTITRTYRREVKNWGICPGDTEAFNTIATRFSRLKANSKRHFCLVGIARKPLKELREFYWLSAGATVSGSGFAEPSLAASF